MLSTRKGITSTLAAVLFALIATASEQSTAVDRTKNISSERYSRDLAFLASPEMKGRGNGTPELEKAADFIAAQFKAAGVQPAGEKSTFFQSLEVTTGRQFGRMNQVTVGTERLELHEDIVPLNFSATAEVNAPLVFVGYGITAPEMHFDEYKGLDVTGKIVLAFRHEPQELDPKSPFRGTEFTTHASFINKAINARQHGAKAIIFITDPNNHKDEPDQVGAATRATEGDDSGIAALHSTRNPWEAVFAAEGRSLESLQSRIDQDLDPQSFELAKARLKLSTEVTRIRKPVRNVIGAIPGSDPVLRDEWIVLGAHYDHLGLGDNHSLAPALIGQTHHGADDNASGTSGMIELARVLARHRTQLKRSVLLMAFSGEELGLLGSAYWVNRPTVPVERVTAMLNMDMIGRLSGDRVFVGGIGTAAEWQKWVEEANGAVSLKLDYSQAGDGSSDHTSFSIRKIPVLFFFSGLHADYHKPSDTVEKINVAGAARVLQLVYLLTDRLANAPARLQYTQPEIPRMPVSGSGDSGYGPYFGSIPDFRDGVQGVPFADVRPGSPAAKAGLRTGDIMIEFDGKPVLTLYDFTYSLRGKKPGDQIVVVVKRGTETVTVNVTLERRQ